jgi:hypothetical protein
MAPGAPSANGNSVLGRIAAPNPNGTCGWSHGFVKGDFSIMHSRHSVPRLFAASLTALVLAACGGGDEASPASFNVAAAMAREIASTGSQTFTMSGTESGVAFTAAGLVVLTKDTVTFEGVSALKRMASFEGTVTAGGQTSLFTSVSNEFYAPSDSSPLGASDNESYSVVQSKTALPSAAKIGDSGNYYQTTDYANSTKNEVRARTTYRYQLEADAGSANAALLRIVRSKVDTQQQAVETGTTSFRLSSDGTLKRLSEKTVDREGESTVTYH